MSRSEICSRTKAGMWVFSRRYVRVNHDFGVETVYGHLARSLVKPGDQLAKGQPLGLVGNTGRSLGPHLHFEIIFKGKPVDPMPYLQ